ncbi:MAG: glycosyltransferase [Candidatus Omnitrophica bacterium]|nr:glycosyltransferase [Candidatus Omnitrophota bacterium]
MKKILVFNAGAYIYGAERGLINFIRTLSDKFEITVVLPSQGPLSKKIEKLNVSLKIFPIPILKISLSPLYYIFFPFHFIFSVIYFSIYAIRKDIEIICSNSLLLVFPAIVAKFTKKRHIWYLREFLPSSFLNKALGAFIIRFSNQIICQSQAIREALLGKERGIIIYEPLNATDYKIYKSDLARSELNIPIKSTVISIISRVHPSKGQYEFIVDIKRTLKKNPNILLVIAGDISPNNLRNRLYKAKIEKLIEGDTLKNVVLLGFRDDVDRILSLSNICVFPFKRKEPFGISVAESLTFGKITFFPQVGGLKEVRDIFGRGNDFSIDRICEIASNFEPARVEKLQELYIPEELSIATYKNKLIPIFEN